MKRCSPAAWDPIASLSPPRFVRCLRGVEHRPGLDGCTAGRQDFPGQDGAGRRHPGEVFHPLWVAYFEFNQNWACPSNAHTHARTSRIFAFVLLSFWMVFFRPALALHGSLHGIVCLVYVQNNTPLFRGNDRRQIVVDLANVAYSGYLSFTAADPCIEGLVIRGALEARRCGAGDFGSTCCCPLLSLHSAGTSAAVMVDIGRCDGECGVFYFISVRDGTVQRCCAPAPPPPPPFDYAQSP